MRMTKFIFKMKTSFEVYKWYLYITNKIIIIAKIKNTMKSIPQLYLFINLFEVFTRGNSLSTKSISTFSENRILAISS